MILYLQQSTDTNHSIVSHPSLCGASWVVRLHDEYIITLLLLAILEYWLIVVSDTRYIIVRQHVISVLHHAHYPWWYDDFYFFICYGFALCCWLSQRGFSSIIFSLDIMQIDCCIHYYCYCVDTYTSLLMSCHYQFIALQPLIDSWGSGNSCLFDPIPSAMHTWPWRIFVAMISLRAMLQDTHLCNSDWQLLLRIRFPYSVSDSMLMFEIRYGFWCQMSAIRFDTWFRCRCLTL